VADAELLMQFAHACLVIQVCMSYAEIIMQNLVHFFLGSWLTLKLGI